MKSCAFASLAAVSICSCTAHALSDLLWLWNAACSCQPGAVLLISGGMTWWRQYPRNGHDAAR